MKQVRSCELTASCRRQTHYLQTQPTRLLDPNKGDDRAHWVREGWQGAKQAVPSLPECPPCCWAGSLGVMGSLASAPCCPRLPQCQPVTSAVISQVPWVNKAVTPERGSRTPSCQPLGGDDPGGPSSPAAGPWTVGAGVDSPGLHRPRNLCPLHSPEKPTGLGLRPLHQPHMSGAPAPRPDFLPPWASSPSCAGGGGLVMRAWGVFPSHPPRGSSDFGERALPPGPGGGEGSWSVRLSAQVRAGCFSKSLAPRCLGFCFTTGMSWFSWWQCPLPQQRVRSEGAAQGMAGLWGPRGSDAPTLALWWVVQGRPCLPALLLSSQPLRFCMSVCP